MRLSLSRVSVTFSSTTSCITPDSCTQQMLKQHAWKHCASPMSMTALRNTEHKSEGARSSLHALLLTVSSGLESGIKGRVGRSYASTLHLVWAKRKVKGGPGLLNFLEAVLNGQLLASLVDNFAAGIHVLVQPQLHQVSQAEVIAHREVHACRLDSVHQSRIAQPWQPTLEVPCKLWSLYVSTVVRQTKTGFSTY